MRQPVDDDRQKADFPEIRNRPESVTYRTFSKGHCGGAYIPVRTVPS